MPYHFRSFSIEGNCNKSHKVKHGKMMVQFAIHATLLSKKHTELTRFVTFPRLRIGGNSRLIFLNKKKPQT